MVEANDRQAGPHCFEHHGTGIVAQAGEDEHIGPVVLLPGLIMGQPADPVDLRGHAQSLGQLLPACFEGPAADDAHFVIDVVWHLGQCLQQQR